MDYKSEMLKWIEIVKQSSFEKPLEQALDDLKIVASVTKDLSDRIEMRVRKGLQASDETKSKPTQVKKTKKKKLPKVPTPLQQLPKPNVQQQQQPSALSTAVSSNDYERLKQNKSASAPITPQPPI